MLEEFTDVDDALLGLPTGPLNLSARMRELRTRQGLKQSEVARRMGLDPSIPSLWEQGKRPVPANRVRALAQALGVELDELLQGLPEPADPSELTREGPARGSMARYGRGLDLDRDDDRSPLLTLISNSRAPFGAPLAAELPPAPAEPPPPPPKPKWVPQERPALRGTIPEGWEPGDRIQDIGPSLPDGYWLDPVRMEKPAARQLLRARLCEADRKRIEGEEVPGAAMAERIHQHCSKEDGFAPTSRLPLMEAIFRTVLGSQYGGLPIEQLVEALGSRGTVPVTEALLRKIGDAVRPYPLRWVDRELFG